MEVTPPRRTFCGDGCVHEWNIRSDANYAREQVWKRDEGRCALCGVDTGEQIEHIERAYGSYQKSQYGGWVRWVPDKERERELSAELERLSIPLHRWRGRGKSFRGKRQGIWDMDHITPVSEGGGSCGLENLRTLCLACHRHETRELRQRKKKKAKRERRRAKLVNYRLFD